jgi:hypothetical protein
LGFAAQKNPHQGIAARVAGLWKVFPFVMKMLNRTGRIVADFDTGRRSRTKAALVVPRALSQSCLLAAKSESRVLEINDLRASTFLFSVICDRAQFIAVCKLRIDTLNRQGLANQR